MPSSSQDLEPSPSSNSARAYIVGGGIAALATAVYLIRDAGLQGRSITLFEQDSVLGGCLDGSRNPEQGYLIRGGRMMEEHFGCTWDLFSQIPSLLITRLRRSWMSSLSSTKPSPLSHVVVC